MKRDEVEEFLRRAAQRRAQAEEQQRRAQQAQGRPVPMPPVPLQPTPFPQPGQPPRRMPPARLVPAGQPQEAILLEPIEAEVVTAELAGTDRIGAAVARDFAASRQIEHRTAQLGERVGLADDTLDAHLHQAFDHEIGRLRTSTAAPAAASPSAGTTPGGSPAANSILQMFRSPENLRNTIILNEIITRPEDRW
jgi:hypothetical protein